MNNFSTHTEEHKSSFNAETIPWLQNITCKTAALQMVAQKFQPQLEQLSQHVQLFEENALLQERVKAAAQYFSKELQQLLQFLSQSLAITG